MQISTKGRYALRFLVDLAQHQGEGPVALREIAERQSLSKKYLEHIITMLSSTDMLQVTRGYQGGYQLAKPASEITVADVLRVAEGGLELVPCMTDSNEPCDQLENCMTAGVWNGLADVMTRYVEGITLQDILDKHGVGAEYCI